MAWAELSNAIRLGLTCPETVAPPKTPPCEDFQIPTCFLVYHHCQHPNLWISPNTPVKPQDRSFGDPRCRRPRRPPSGC